MEVTPYLHRRDLGAFDRIAIYTGVGRLLFCQTILKRWPFPPRKLNRLEGFFSITMQTARLSSKLPLVFTRALEGARVTVH